MKKAVIIVCSILVASATWMAIARKPLPPVPLIVEELSSDVDLSFEVNNVNTSGIELSLQRPPQGKGMYVQFQMGNAFKTGRAGLVLKGIRGNPGLGKGMSADEYLKEEGRGKDGRDFGNFMKDKRGKEISAYKFRQTLVKDDKGESFMQMSYLGPEVEMIQLLEIPQPVTLPAHISGLFIEKGIIQFQKGTVALDPKIKGFYIPVTIR